MDQATFCIVLRVPGMDCATLCDHCAIQFLPFSTWYSYTSILTQYGVIIETFFYICTFCITFLSIGFECILIILWDSLRILSLMCIYWSQDVCCQERKCLYQVSIRSFNSYQYVHVWTVMNAVLWFSQFALDSNNFIP